MTSATTVEKLHQGFCCLGFLSLITRIARTRNRAWGWPPRNDGSKSSRKGNWLDNVSREILVFLRGHLRCQIGRGSILFAARTDDVAIVLASAPGERYDVEVPLLTIKDGVELFLGHFRDAYGSISAR